MLDYLNHMDTVLFRFFNSTISNPIFDVLMPFLTDLNKQRFVLVLVGTLLLWMIIRGKRSIRLAAVCLIVTVLFSDQLSSSVIKYWLIRDRPCHVLEDVKLLVSCGSGYSFPSSHAVNNFAGALMLAFFFPRAKWWYFGFAAVIAFSRVYVGVHYPLDVVGGCVIGLMCGGCMLGVFQGLEYLWYRIKLTKLKFKNS
jgi:undecaprenyl-diphosphatase